MNWNRSATLGLMLLAILALSSPLSAQEAATSAHATQHRFRFVDLGNLGGPQTFLFGGDILSHVQAMNKSGTVAGWSGNSMPDPYPDFCWDGDCVVAHTFQWKNGRMQDLGTLRAGASSDARWISANGLISGDSENGAFDPLMPGFPEIRATLWEHGKIIDLGTLRGGHESIAHAVNSSGQVVGLSLTTVPDPDSMTSNLYGWAFQTRAFLWQNGEMRDLGTLGSGTNAIALLVNESGQVAGDSYTNSTPSDICALLSWGGFQFSTGAFLWQNGKMIDLGNFGGSCTIVRDLNNRGQVVGFSTLAGDTSSHAFLWDPNASPHLKDLGSLGGDGASATAVNELGDVAGTADIPGAQLSHSVIWSHGHITDIGTLNGYPCNLPFSINSQKQVAGISGSGASSLNCDFEEASAFFWEPGGTITDLNAFLPYGSDLHLRNGVNINDLGEILVYAKDPDGNLHASALVPCDNEPANSKGCLAAHPVPVAKPQ